MTNEVRSETGLQAKRALLCMAGFVAALMVLFVVMAVSPAHAQTADSAQSDPSASVQQSGANDATDTRSFDHDEPAGLGTGMVLAGEDGSLSGAAAPDEEAADTAAGLAMVLMVGAGAVVIHETLRG